MTDMVKCETCGNTGPRDTVQEWHQYRHPFNADGTVNAFTRTPGDQVGGSSKPASVTVFGRKEGTVMSTLTMSSPFDPVLRQALIDKGVLTPEDLTAAETKIRAVTNVFTGEVPT